MKKKRGLFGVLFIITALIIMQLPVTEADAATSASAFKMEGTTLVKYRGTDINVSVPDDVEIIAEGAFEENDDIELVVLPNSVKTIEPYAFWGCDSLEKVILGRGITEVGDFTFANCTGLTDVSIPENVRSIGIQAFADCVNMTDIKIPAQVTNIHETAFDGCGKLVIHCEPGSYADEYARSFYEKQKDMPEYEDLSEDSQTKPQTTQVPEETSTPEPTSTPTSYDDGGTTLGSSIVVGNQALILIDNTELTVYGEENKTEQNDNNNPVEEDASHKTEHVTIDKTDVPKYCIVDGSVVADQAYYLNSALKDVILPNGIKEIGEFSYARSSIQTISIPDTVESICYGAFYHCDNLAEVELPESIRNVEPCAFAHTAWVNDFKNSSGRNDFLISGGVLVAYRGENSSVTIPDEVRVIGAEVFSNHSEIKKVVLPDGLLVIGEGAFENCSALSELILGKNLQEVKDRAFAGCNLSKIKLPQSVKEIGLKSFDERVEIGYNGEVPTKSYETSAQRLSNESYRKYGYTVGDAGVKVVGIQNAYADLADADKSYTLKISKASDSTRMEKAFKRNMQMTVPVPSAVYDLQLTDSSNIPLTKLGKQLLTLTIPIPNELKGQEIKVLMLDRNGQIEAFAVEKITVDGMESIRFKTDYIAQFIVYGTGVSYENE